MEEHILKPDTVLVEPLTRRESEILSLLAANRSNREIGDQLTIALTTVKWYNTQIFGKLGVQNRHQAVQRAITLGLIDRGFTKHNIPAQPTPLIGREKERIEINRLLTESDCRLLTLTGPGGIGKTRLALQAAVDLIEQKQGLFSDGVFFVALAPLEEPADILPTIADAIQFTFYEGGEIPSQQLFSYLQHKSFLLLLDNFEHLLNEYSAGLVVDLLTSSDGSRLLVTSRTRLNILEEQVFPVNGMKTPPEDMLRAWSDSPKAALTCSGIQLFQQRACQVHPAFEITPENLEPITKICQFVGGLPLGIELAAAWVEALEPDVILTELKAGPDFLATEMHAIPKRQRSIRAVFDTSWRLLDESERLAVRNLSIFRGSFTKEAADQVAGLKPRLLLALVGKSWIQRVAPARFLMHTMLKAYAGQSLQEDSALWQSARESHAAYFCRHLKRLEPDLRGGDQQEAIREIEQDVEDIQAAWRWALSSSRFDLFDQALHSLCTYYDWRGRYVDGEALCRIATEKMSVAYTNDPAGVDVYRFLWAKVLAWRAHFTQEYETAAALLQQSQQILDESGVKHDRYKRSQVVVWFFLGNHLSWNDREAARLYYEKCLTLSREIGDMWYVGRTLRSLGWFAWTTGDPRKARPLLEQSLAIQKQIGDQLGASESLNNLGLVARDLGETHKAEQLLLESLAICEAIGARFKMASRLILVAFSYINNGKFTEGLARARLSLHIYHEMGYTGAWTAKSRLTIGAALICMGKYSEARIELEQALDIARENSSLQDIGMTLRHLGELALVEGRYAEAQEILTESLSVFDKIKYSQWRSHSNSLGYAARYQGEMAEAYNYLLHSLEQVIHSRNELMLAEFIPLAALLALDSGEIEQAIELYALASRYPLVANNRWFDDLVGNQIAAAAVTLPALILQTAQQRGKSLDLWETAQGLVFELRNKLN